MTDVNLAAEDLTNFVDFNNMFFTPAFVAGCLDLTTRRLADIEAENGLEIRRIPSGSVPRRTYTAADIFEISALRRALGHVKGLDRQIVVSTFVPKGGTGKTNTAVSLAIDAQMAGLKTLIIDNDPQGDSSCMLGYDPDLDPDDLKEMGIPADRLVDGHIGNLISPLLRMRPFETKTLDQVIKKPFGENGIHIIPADSSLEDLGFALDASNNPDMWYLKWIDAASTGNIPGCDLSGYDLIIFDNAPSGSRLTKSSVAASELLLCPVRMDKFSFKALIRLHDWCVRFSKEYNYSPAIAAIPTMFKRKRTRLLNNLVRLNGLFPGRVTEEKIFFSEDYEKALDLGIPLMLWKGANKDTLHSARAVYREILDRIRNLAKDE